jgi:hypothetical protein
MRESLLGGTRVDGAPVNGAPAGAPPNAGGSIGAHLAVAVVGMLLSGLALRCWQTMAGEGGPAADLAVIIIVIGGVGLVRFAALRWLFDTNARKAALAEVAAHVSPLPRVAGAGADAAADDGDASLARERLGGRRRRHGGGDVDDAATGDRAGRSRAP